MARRAQVAPEVNHRQIRDYINAHRRHVHDCNLLLKLPGEKFLDKDNKRTPEAVALYHWLRREEFEARKAAKRAERRLLGRLARAWVVRCADACIRGLEPGDVLILPAFASACMSRRVRRPRDSA